MGQDYSARKSAKKGRKRMARDGATNDGQAKRQRKKNQPRRLCRCKGTHLMPWGAFAAYQCTTVTLAQARQRLCR